jgi:hypothetical protein
VAAIARELEARGVATRRKGGLQSVVYPAVAGRPDLFERLRGGLVGLKSHPAR